MWWHYLVGFICLVVFYFWANYRGYSKAEKNINYFKREIKWLNRKIKEKEKFEKEHTKHINGLKWEIKQLVDEKFELLKQLEQAKQRNYNMKCRASSIRKY